MTELMQSMNTTEKSSFWKSNQLPYCVSTSTSLSGLITNPKVTSFPSLYLDTSYKIMHSIRAGHYASPCIRYHLKKKHTRSHYVM